jgi:hypothetical protein
MTIVTAPPADAQFRRGMLADAREVTLFPVEAPAMLMPSNATVEVVVRNASSAPARIVEKVKDLLGRQLTDNDPRLRLTEQKGDLVLTATLTEWAESRRNSTKYVSETRQVGTREVTDKNGKKRTEPVYEYGRNRPSVVINANAGVRVEVRQRGGGATLADESARHAISEEHVADQSPPSREAVEDLLIDNVLKKAAGRVTPGRTPMRVLLARSDDVDKLNDLALDRKWQAWETALGAVPPHRDRKRDSYRLHNLAVANEAIAYESEAVEDAVTRLTRATGLIAQASVQNKDERYITESQTRIGRSSSAYVEVARLQQMVNTSAAASRSAERSKPAAPAATPVPAPGSRGETMTNAEVIELRTAGLDDDNLIAAIKEAKSVNFDLSPAGLRALLQAKVSNRVITAMRARK